MKKVSGMYILFFFFLFTLFAGHVQAETTKATLKEQMKNKLSYAQDLLEAIVLEDFAKIEKSAGDLKQICELVGWTEEKTKGHFENHDTEFHDTAREMISLAKDKNLEGVHYKYNHLIMSCIDCHQHIRDIQATEKYPGAVHEGEYLYKGRHIKSR
jgi:hypothetical protein